MYTVMRKEYIDRYGVLIQDKSKLQNEFSKRKLISGLDLAKSRSNETFGELSGQESQKKHKEYSSNDYNDSAGKVMALNRAVQSTDPRASDQTVMLGKASPMQSNSPRIANKN